MRFVCQQVDCAFSHWNRTEPDGTEPYRTASCSQGILFTAVVLCMDDDLLVPPRDAPVGELVTVKGHPPTPSKNASAVSLIWDKVLNEELLQVGDDEVSYTFFLRANARASNLHGTKIQVPLYDFGVVYVRTCF